MYDKPMPRPWTTYENRCDRCESESFYRMTRGRHNGDAIAELFFCGHHGNKHALAMSEGGWIIENYTHQINVAPSVSANAV